MSVLIVTSLGDIVVDLHADKCPLTCKNFLKLCKMKYYNGCLFHTVQKDFTAQTGDPSGTGRGGDSLYKFLYGDQARFFSDEIHLDLKHLKTGTVAMASAGENLNASQFYITLRDGLDYLDGKHTVFGEVAEGLETLKGINEAFVDENSRPCKNIRIKHTYILDDPFDDPPQLAELIPEASPEGRPKDEVEDNVRLEDDWVALDEKLGPAELEEMLRSKDAHSSAVVLESIGDIPDAEIKPPDNVLFVCKLNPVTEDEDLHTIFSRFGTVISAEIIRDYKTGDSLCYAFIEFESRDACEEAYYKMDNSLIDDRRIHVDFSQSVSKLWSQYRRKEQMGKGKGCFKCGATDHIAKDCTGDPSLGQQAKYTLKEENTQHGGGNARYEMVFDGDNHGNPTPGRNREGNYPSNHIDKRSRGRISENNRDRCEKNEDLDASDRHGDRSRGHRDDARGMDSKHRAQGTRGQDYEERKERESHVGRRRERDSRKNDIRDGRKIDHDDGQPEKRDIEDYRSKHTVEERTQDDRDGRKIDHDDGQPEKRDIEDYRSKHTVEERTQDDRVHRNRDGQKRGKPSVDDDEHGDRTDDRDYKKRYKEFDRRDTRNELNHRRNAVFADRDRRHGHEHGHGSRYSERDRRYGGHRR